jgi:hypothetical protein
MIKTHKVEFINLVSTITDFVSNIIKSYPSCHMK